MCLVAWPLNESEAGADLILIETSLLFLRKFLLISMRTASLAWEKQEDFYQSKITIASPSFKGQATKHTTVKWSVFAYICLQLSLKIPGKKFQTNIWKNWKRRRGNFYGSPEGPLTIFVFLFFIFYFSIFYFFILPILVCFFFTFQFFSFSFYQFFFFFSLFNVLVFHFTNFGFFF